MSKLRLKKRSHLPTDTTKEAGGPGDMVGPRCQQSQGIQKAGGAWISLLLRPSLGDLAHFRGKVYRAQSHLPRQNELPPSWLAAE